MRLWAPFLEELTVEFILERPVGIGQVKMSECTFQAQGKVGAKTYCSTVRLVQESTNKDQARA